MYGAGYRRVHSKSRDLLGSLGSARMPESAPTSGASPLVPGRPSRRPPRGPARHWPTRTETGLHGHRACTYGEPGEADYSRRASAALGGGPVSSPRRPHSRRAAARTFPTRTPRPRLLRGKEVKARPEGPAYASSSSCVRRRRRSRRVTATAAATAATMTAVITVA